MSEILDKKIALVTGGNTGIGRSICIELAKKNYHVIINYVCNEEETNALIKEIEDANGSCEGIYGDVSDYSSCENMYNQIKDKYGKCDILINNAGITKDGLLMRMSEEDFDKVIKVNLKGTFNMTKLFTNMMLKNKYGRVVNMASIVGTCGNVGQVNYSASKAGIIGITKSVAKEYAKKNITCNAVAPGFIRTKMTDAMTDQAKEQTLQSIPVGRIGEAEDIANAVMFLVDDKASYITGQVIHVDGGMYM